MPYVPMEKPRGIHDTLFQMFPAVLTEVAGRQKHRDHERKPGFAYTLLAILARKAGYDHRPGAGIRYGRTVPPSGDGPDSSCV